jgi:hypothetical protein
MITADIKGDLSRVTEALAQLGATTKYIKIDMLRKTGRGAISVIKKSYKRYLKQSTGELYRSLKPMLSRKGGFTLLYAHKHGYIAWAHENGSIIKSKNYKYMTYRVGGKWFKSKQIQLKKSPFFSEGWDAYIGSPMQDDINIVMAKAMDKFNAQTEAKG